MDFWNKKRKEKKNERKSKISNSSNSKHSFEKEGKEERSKSSSSIPSSPEYILDYHLELLNFHIVLVKTFISFDSSQFDFVQEKETYRYHPFFPSIHNLLTYKYFFDYLSFNYVELEEINRYNSNYSDSD